MRLQPRFFKRGSSYSSFEENSCILLEGGTSLLQDTANAAGSESWNRKGGSLLNSAALFKQWAI